MMNCCDIDGVKLTQIMIKIELQKLEITNVN